MRGCARVGRDGKLSTMPAPVLLTAPNLTVPHGFATRLGGVSEGVYESLNFGLSTGDDPAKVAQNRCLLMRAFGVGEPQVCALQQVHGDRVVVAEPGLHDVEADAAVTSEPDLLLTINTADCLPILVHDPVTGSVGAAHAGWRGTVKYIAAKLVEALSAHYGSSPADLRVALGPAIQQRSYQVGLEVKQVFDEHGFPPEVCTPDAEGRWRLDVPGANRFVLLEAGVRDENIYTFEDCTLEQPERFYSHRRDGRARGAHWSAIKLPG